MPALRPAQRNGEEEGPDGPEGNFITALLHTGEFNPEQYRITRDHLGCWVKLFDYCHEYQQKAGVAPPLDLIKRDHPDFVIGPELNVRWAAHKLHETAASRRLRSGIRAALVALDEEDLDAAYAELQGIERPHAVRKKPITIYDEEEEATLADERIDVPYPTLARVAGGIGPGELWYWAMRAGEGKTMNLNLFAALAIEQGCNVQYLSCEMPARVIVKRVRRALARKDRKTLAMLDSGDPIQMSKAVENLKAKNDVGTMHVHDPSSGPINVNTAREVMEGAHLVVVDHAGLLKTHDNRRAIDDWRTMATISNTLKEHCLSTGVPILAAVQLNREAAASGMSPPKLTTLSQSDALAQDGDVVVTGKKLSETTRVYGAEKVREGSGIKWYARYDVARSDYSELSKEQLQEFIAIDDDKSAD